MDNELKELLAAAGRFLLTLAGEECAAPEHAVQQDETARKKFQRKELPMSCVRCGSAFTARTPLAKYCPACKKAISLEKLKLLAKTTHPAQAAGRAAAYSASAHDDDPDLIYGNSIEL